MTCERCQHQTLSLIMSWFNTQMICEDCRDKETKHPQYKEARDAELQALKQGEYKFPGIGWRDGL